MARVCVREHHAPDSLELHVPRLFCPACRLWPATTRRAAAGGPLFPGWTARRALQGLRPFARIEGWRRGTRGEPVLPEVEQPEGYWMLEARSPSCYDRANGASAYQLYLVLGREESSAVASIIIEASDED